MPLRSKSYVLKINKRLGQSYMYFLASFTQSSHARLLLVMYIHCTCIENNTGAHIDMEFLFKYSTSSRYQVEHEKKNSISPSNLEVLLCLMKPFLMIFWRFLKILQTCSEGQTKCSKHFIKITEDCWRWLKFQMLSYCFHQFDV